jgi:ubiquinone/menaquinone biosynthesis C-methylase UbiE
MPTIAQAGRKYDELAENYEEIFFYVADLGRQLIDFADPPRAARMLDIGAGRGAVARAALSRGCRVLAIDASIRMAGRLAADHPEIATHQMDAAHLAFRDASFDLVTAGFVIQVLDHPAAVLTEIRRVLRPGGVVALSLETQSPGRLQWLHDLSAEFFAGGRPAPTTSGPLAEDRLDTLLHAAGFADVTRKSVQMPRPLADPDALWQWMGPRGLADAVTRLPAARATEFRTRFLAEAQRMQDDGGIVLDFAATLHRGTAPRA